MLSRRTFSACAICALTGFAATAVGETEAQAQTTSGVKRTVLEKAEFPDNYLTVTVLGEIEPGVSVARHTHPGVETAYILDGELDLYVQGQPARRLKAGDTYLVAREVPHSGRAGDKPVKVVGTYVVEKDKPLASPAPE